MSDDPLAAELGVTPAPTPPAIIEAEVVAPSRAPKVKKRTGSFPLTPKQIRKRDHSFSEVALRDGETLRRGRLSDRERKLITILLKTGSKQKAADEIGVTYQTVHNYLKRPFVKFYLEKMRERAAKAADLTMDKVAGVLSDAVDGVGGITPQQITAATAAAKLLNPGVRPGVNVTVNQQNNFNGTSPFADLKPADMLKEIQNNLLEMGVDAPPAAQP